MMVMKIWLLILIISCIELIKCQEEEFTFGGAAEEEAEEKKPDPPKITFNQKEIVNMTFWEMQTVYVKGGASNYKAGEYMGRWKDSSGKIIYPNSIFHISSVLKKNEGSYTYEMTMKQKKKLVYTKILNLFVQIPSISISILQGESLKIGGRILRQCSDLGIDPSTIKDSLSYKWLNQKGEEVSTTNILDIKIQDKSVEGPYTCQLISQDTGKIYSAKTDVRIPIAGRSRVDYRLYLILNPKSLEYKRPFSIRCEIPNFSGQVEYKWYRDDEFLSNEQTISFPSFEKKTTGVYKCEANLLTQEGRVTLYGSTTHQINMYQEGKIELEPKPGPKLFVHNGDKKELHCEIETRSGLRGRDAEWYINGKLFQQGSIKNVNRLDRQFVSILVIDNIESTNEGNYACKLKDDVKEVNIFVLMRPGLIVTSPKTLTVEEGEPVEFHCRIDNIPNTKNSNLRWRFESKDGSVKYNIPDSEWELSNNPLTEQTSFISKYNAKVLDTGYYICSEPGGRTARSELVVIPSKKKLLITITPKIIRVRPNQKFEIECFSKNSDGQPIGKPEFFFSDNRPVTTDSRFVVSQVGPAHYKLTTPNGLPLSMNNLQIVCSTGSSSDRSTIYIKDLCPPNHRYCQNGQCLENGKFCNGVNDCADGSDENPVYCSACDPISTKCQNFNGQIPKKNYFLVHWACDGEQDCGNGFDEADENCGENYFQNCGGKMFTCQGGKQIPRGYVCDKSQDCPQADDEQNCRAPQITKESDAVTRASRSSNVILNCEAVGTPIPSIIWRFNWNCLPKNGRFKFTSSSPDCKTVRSQLTITNFQPGDDGIYNCEALSTTKRAFSTDMQVILQNNN